MDFDDSEKEDTKKRLLALEEKMNLMGDLMLQVIEGRYVDATRISDFEKQVNALVSSLQHVLEP